MNDLTISVVSHGQIDMISFLLIDLKKNCKNTNINVIITINIPEKIPEFLDQLPYSVLTLKNISPLGFGENHNRAFQFSKSSLFAVINPDIRIDSDIFQALIDGLENISCGVISPLIVDGDGTIENSARKFPTPLKIICKFFGGCTGLDYKIGTELLQPDWVGGMFMVFRRDTYALLGGFDQRFFLYYEDVDLCARIRLQGLRVVMNPSVRATHFARRSSHRKISYFLIHIQSMVRFFASQVFIKIMWHRER
jgi:N-acetylglucosaminyl-diphospho-decaprenol L-rhamnosyltransferase